MHAGKLKNITDEELLVGYQKLGSLNSLAKSLGVSHAAIQKHFKTHNLGYTKRQLRVFDRDFFSQDSPASFYVAGFIAADGNIYDEIDNSGKSHYDLSISLKEEDKSHLEKIQKLLHSDHKLYRRLIKNSQRDPSYSDSVSYTLFIYSPEIIRDLKRFNITSRKSLVYTMPPWLKEHSLVKYFLLGYFDGDGSISIDKLVKGRCTPQARIHIRGTQELLIDLHKILHLNCQLPTLNKTISKKSGIYSLQYTGNPSICKIMSYLYEDTPIYLDRKHNRYLEIVDNLIL